MKQVDAQRNKDDRIRSSLRFAQSVGTSSSENEAAN